AEQQSSRAAEQQSSRAAEQQLLHNSFSKYLLIAAIMILFLSNYNKAISDEISSSLCCDYIDVNFTDTTNCCVFIEIYNPYCSAKILFQLFNPITQEYETVDYNDSYNSNISFLICPKYGLDIFEIRVAFIDPGTSNYFCIWSSEPAEGYNSYSYSRDASQCCECPDETTNGWFTTTVGPNPDLCPDGCAVVHNLNIPDNITCFKYYYYDNLPMNVIASEPPHSIETYPISNYNGCINPGETSEAYITLLRYPGDPNPCILSHTKFCDTTNIPDTIDIDLPEPCMTECEGETWEYHVAIYPSDICPGCNVQVNYVTRTCQGKQELEILALVRKNWQCELCSKDLLMKEAFGKIINMNEMQFKPQQPGQCDTTWQVGSGGCWATYPEYYMRRADPILDPTYNPFDFVIDSVMVSVKCDSSDCCILPITVCKDSNGVHVMPNIVPDWLSICGFNFINIWGNLYFCLPNCDWMLLIGDFYPLAINKKLIENFNIENINTTIGTINYNKESIDLSKYIKKGQKAELKIYNLHGSVIHNIVFTDTNKHLNLNTINLSNGVYFYSLVIDGISVKTEKVIIVN
ncbi:MAG: T9SS type A sorting domain-containing protein, partial [Candidatus Kapabacteria bacterium]|nr:T9SS type A sorting domain-containing protein [Candidatus Kapabacteria bacterium]